MKDFFRATIIVLALLLVMAEADEHGQISTEIQR